MADISLIRISGTTYSLKDAALRNQIGAYSLGKSVPADAVFTDTTYSQATSSNLGLMYKPYFDNDVLKID